MASITKDATTATRRAATSQLKKLCDAIAAIEKGTTEPKLERQLARIQKKVELVRASFPPWAEMTKEVRKNYRAEIRPLFNQERFIYFLLDND